VAERAGRHLEAEWLRALEDGRPVMFHLVSGRDIAGSLVAADADCLEVRERDTSRLVLIYRRAVAAVLDEGETSTTEAVSQAAEIVSAAQEQIERVERVPSDGVGE
jgi:hypothetical protein